MTKLPLGDAPADDEDAPWIEPVLPKLDERLELSADIQRQNSEHLIQLYYQRTTAPAAVALYADILSGERQAELGTILRDHRDRPIGSAEEIAWRNAFDELMTCYSVLELAMQAGYITDFGPTLRRDASQILEDRCVREFYEDHYPLLLPQLFRDRLSRRIVCQTHLGPRQLAALQRAIELERRLLQHPEVQAFLMLADDFVVEGFWRSHLLDAVSDAEKLEQHLTRRGENQTFLDRAVGGLRRFLYLCDGLQRLLLSVEGDAIFQSGLWHLFGYWFSDRREAVVPTLLRMIEQIEEWSPPDLSDDEMVDQVRMEDLRADINALASGRYGVALREAFIKPPEAMAT
jgi:hypothetical protein